MNISIQCITERKEFYELRNNWNNLLEESGSNNVYQTFEWSYTWWKYFANNKTLFLLVAKCKNGKMIGIAPLTIHRSRFFGLSWRLLQFISVTVSDPSCDYYDFIILQEFRDECIRAIFEYIHKHSHMWDVLFLQNIPEWSENYPIVREELKGCYAIYESPTSAKMGINNDICPYIPINCSWDKYYNALGKNVRKSYRKKKNRLERIGHLEYRKVSEHETIDPILYHLFELHKEKWGTAGELSKFSREDIREFHREIASIFSQKNWLDLSVLNLDGKPLAIHFGFSYKQKLYYYCIAHDIEYDYYSPGELLIMYSIENAFREGMKEFDFMSGDEGYKFKWAKCVRTNSQIRTYQKTASGYLASIWIERIRKWMSMSTTLRRIRRSLTA